MSSSDHLHSSGADDPDPFPIEFSVDDVSQLVEQAGACGGDGQMSCEEAADLIMVYLDSIAEQGAVDSTVFRMREHLGLCPPCESEFAVYQQISVSLSRCRPALPPETKQRLERFCSDLCSGDDDRS